MTDTPEPVAEDTAAWGSIACATCGQRLVISEDQQGTDITCTVCDNVTRVPDNIPTAQSAADTAALAANEGEVN